MFLPVTVTISIYTDTTDINIIFITCSNSLYGVPLANNNAKNRRIIFWIMYFIAMISIRKLLVNCQMCEASQDFIFLCSGLLFFSDCLKSSLQTWDYFQWDHQIIQLFNSTQRFSRECSIIPFLCWLWLIYNSTK